MQALRAAQLIDVSVPTRLQQARDNVSAVGDVPTRDARANEDVGTLFLNDNDESVWTPYEYTTNFGVEHLAL